MIDQSIPEGLHLMERTHMGQVHEELQHMERTHVGEVNEGLSSMGGLAC